MPTRARTRNRRAPGPLVLWAVLSLVVVAGLSALVKLDAVPLERVDTALGTGPEAWTFAHPVVSNFLIGVQYAFGTVAMTVYTAVVALALYLRKHTRAAVWTVGVMVGAALTTTALKQLFQRDRPVWQDAIEHVSSRSF